MKMNTEEELLDSTKENEQDEETLRKIKLIRTPRHMLRKCEFCNFRRISCQLDPQGCKIKTKSCWLCQEQGHYTQSLCFMRRRLFYYRNSSVKKWSTNCRSNIEEQENIKLINSRINQLEAIPMCQDFLKLKTEKIQKEIIRKILDQLFLIMFFCNNYSVICSKETVQKIIRGKILIPKHTNHKKEVKKRNKILKLAMACSNDLENETNIQTFSHNCAMKLRRIKKETFSLNHEDMMVLDYFEKMFYTPVSSDTESSDDKDEDFFSRLFELDTGREF